jgi:hypothetical protein
VNSLRSVESRRGGRAGWPVGPAETRDGPLDARYMCHFAMCASLDMGGSKAAGVFGGSRR